MAAPVPEVGYFVNIINYFRTGEGARERGNDRAFQAMSARRYGELT